MTTPQRPCRWLCQSCDWHGWDDELLSMRLVRLFGGMMNKKVNEEIRRHRLAYENMVRVIRSCLTEQAMTRFVIEEELRRTDNKRKDPPQQSSYDYE